MKVTKPETLPERLYILDQLASGKTIQELATQLDVPIGQLRRQVKEEQEYYLKQMGNAVAEIKIMQTRQYTSIYNQAMKAWERSTQPDDDGNPTKSGDSRLLDTAMKALKELKVLWQADQPIEYTEDGMRALPAGTEKKKTPSASNPNQVEDVLLVLQQLEMLPQNIDVEKVQAGLEPIEGDFNEIESAEGGSRTHTPKGS